jgi:hypothetical protein
MMTWLSEKEILEVTNPRYLKASKARKTRILDNFIAAVRITVEKQFEY